MPDEVHLDREAIAKALSALNQEALERVRAANELLVAANEVANAALQLSSSVEEYVAAANELAVASGRDQSDADPLSQLGSRRVIVGAHSTIVQISAGQLQAAKEKFRAVTTRVEPLFKSPQTAIPQTPASHTTSTPQPAPVRNAHSETTRVDDWDDLPEYHGETSVFRSSCLHCDSPLPPGNKQFCSNECREFHLNAYGSRTLPTRKRRR